MGPPVAGPDAERDVRKSVLVVADESSHRRSGNETTGGGVEVIVPGKKPADLRLITRSLVKEGIATDGGNMRRRAEFVITEIFHDASVGVRHGNGVAQLVEVTEIKI